MPRRQRIYLPEGAYHVIQRISPQRPVFSQADDYALFEHLLADALNRTGAILHAYCWKPDAIHLVLQVDEIPIGDFMAVLTSRYARRIHRRTGEKGHFFARRYESVLIDPDTYLLRLIHHLHHLPVADGLAKDPDEYPHTSHRAYLGTAHMPWVHTRTALRLLDSLDEDRIAYRRFMSDASVQTGELYEHGHPDTPGILAGPEFLFSLPRRLRPVRRTVSFDQIFEQVTCALDVPRERVLSKSRQHNLVLARAAIAWHATERRVATLREVARYLRRDPAGLSRSISRYRECCPELFRLDAFHHLAPLVQLESRAA